MFFLPLCRRHPGIVLFAVVCVCLWRLAHRQGISISFVFHQSSTTVDGIQINSSTLAQPRTLAYAFSSETNNPDSASPRPKTNPYLEPLWTCSRTPNRHTGHIRLPFIIQNVSAVSQADQSESRAFWNPTVMALPYWSTNQYLLVSRILTFGNYQETIVCEANFCSAPTGPRSDEPLCTEEDLIFVGPSGGLRCVHPPQIVGLPPTPAKHCDGKLEMHANIPGAHDPRIFYGGSGEPLMMLNTQSRYACFGLWMIDLRAVYLPLGAIISSSPKRLSLGPVVAYRHLTEITRVPDASRGPMEKNWFLFSSGNEAFVHYDIPSSSRGRTFAKLLGGGLASSNLTSPLEDSCLPSHPEFETIPHPQKHWGKASWHQATNALRLVLCRREDSDCASITERTVFFALVHKKFSNHLKLPLRYERYFMLWAAEPPFNVLGFSRYPILLANETASGWEAWQNWEDDFYPDDDNRRTVLNKKGGEFAPNTNGSWDSNMSTATMNKRKTLVEESGGVVDKDGSVPEKKHTGWQKDLWAYFTYTVSIAWARGRPATEIEDMQEGYLDDEVVLSIGVDDKGQAVARVKSEELLQCLWACPGAQNS